MTQWTVLLTDRSTVTVEVPANLPEWRQENVAMVRAHDRITKPGLRPFAAKPIGCTGFAYNVHTGADEACPIHRTRNETVI